MPVGKEAGHHIVLTIVIENVSHVPALLQHIAGTGKIICPRLGLLCPSLMTVKPLAEDQQPQTRLLVIYGLMSAFVNHEAVHTVSHLQVCRSLQVAREITIGATVQTVGSQRLGCHVLLSIEMCH